MEEGFFQKGNKEAFKQFFESSYAGLCLFANKYLKDREMAMDIVQDAFLYIWNKSLTFNTPEAARYYLYNYVRHKSLNYLRNQKMHRMVDMKELEPESFFRDSLIEEETYRILFTAVGSLPPQSQRVMELSLDGLKNKEIADRLNVTLNTIKTIKLRAFSAIRTEIGNYVCVAFLCFVQKGS